jgi:hypothetical protein
MAPWACTLVKGSGKRYEGHEEPTLSAKAERAKEAREADAQALIDKIAGSADCGRYQTAA